MQTVITRFLPPTNTRGARIKVISAWGSRVYPFDHAADCAHRSAFNQFLAEWNADMSKRHPDCQAAVQGEWWKLVACADSLDNRGFTFIIK